MTLIEVDGAVAAEIEVTAGVPAVIDVIGNGLPGPRGADGAAGADGAPGADGVVQSVVAGANITVDNTDPANPVVASTASGGGAPTDATYLTATANGDLSAEVVVGATPGGELGGTWASPTVDTVHSGSSHAATQAAAEATADAALSAHAATTSGVHGISSFVAGALDEATVGAFLTALGIDADVATLAVPASTTISSFVAGALDETTIAAFLTALGLDADLATLAVPASTTISAFGASLIDDADAAAARTTLGAAPLASPAFTGTPTAPTPSAMDNSTKLATTAYVDGALAGLEARAPVAYASTSALPSNTYSNGSSGVGATLTGTANGPLIIDGVTLGASAVGQRVLIAGESTQANNGIYVVTQQGTIAVNPYILTRATDMDQAAEITSGLLFAVEAPTGLTVGSNNNGKLFASVCASPFTVGTTALNFSLIGTAYTAGTGLTLTGTTFSLTNPVTVALGGTGVASLTAHDLIIGNGTGAVTLLAPSSTSGVPLISQGASADPAYGTAVVAGGGTGATTLANHGVLVGQGTSAVAAVGPDSTSTKYLRSNGSSADPSYQAIAESEVTNLTTDLGALQTSTAVQAAQIECRRLADLGQFVCGPTSGGMALSANASALTSVTSTVSTSVFNKTAHGLVANDTIAFSGLTNTTGVTNGTVYFVSATGLTANAFRVAATSGGTAITLGGSDDTGLTVTQVGKLDMAAGVSFMATTELNAAAQTAIATTIASMSDATNPKWVVVEYDSSNVVQFNQGTAAASPAFPTITATRTPLGFLYVPANTTKVDTLFTTNNGFAKLIDARIVRLYHPTRKFYIDHAQTVLTNISALTSVFAAAPSIPALSLSVDDVFRIDVAGATGITTNNGTMEVKLTVGSVTVVDWTSGTLTASATSRRWRLEATLVVATIGATGTILFDGTITIGDLIASSVSTVTAANRVEIGRITGSIDMTAAQTLDLKIFPSNTGNTNTTTMGPISILKIPA